MTVKLPAVSASERKQEKLLVTQAREMADELVHLRRALHQEPEVGLNLPRTQERVLTSAPTAACPVSPPTVRATWSRRVSAWSGPTPSHLSTFPPGAGFANLPVHRILLQDSGMNIIEAMNLEALAHTGAREFVFVGAPLPVVGATGAPIRPLALVEEQHVGSGGQT